MIMAVSPANIAVGDFYVCFTEVREVISVARSGDVTFLARSSTHVVGREPMRLDTRSRELFAVEVDRRVGPQLSDATIMRRFRIARSYPKS
jgi:hypothetical protein